MINFFNVDRVTWFMIAAIIALTIVPLLNNFSLTKLIGENRELQQRTVNVVLENNRLLLQQLNDTSNLVTQSRDETHHILLNLESHDKEASIRCSHLLDTLKDVADRNNITIQNMTRFNQLCQRVD